MKPFYITSTLATLSWMLLILMLMASDDAATGAEDLTDQYNTASNCAKVPTISVGIRQYYGHVCYEQGMFFEYIPKSMPDSIYQARVLPVKDSLKTAVEGW